jgi:hypothetical protein
MAHAWTETTDEIEERDETEEPDKAETVEEPAESSGLGTEVYLGLLWLGISMYVAHATITTGREGAPGALGDALTALPDLIVSTVVTSASISHAASSRFSTAGRRLLVGVGTGVLFGLVSALGLRFGYGHARSITVLAVVVGLASVAGGIFAMLPDAVLEAGLWASTWVFFLGVMSGVWHDPVTTILGGGPTATAAAQASANTRFILGMSLFAGVVSAFYSFRNLRNEPPGWVWFGVAAATPGAMMITAEYLTRLGGSSLVKLVHGVSADPTSLANLTDWGRLRHALIVFAVGGVVALVAATRTLGRSRRRG